jgi:hypothetical protein
MCQSTQVQLNWAIITAGQLVLTSPVGVASFNSSTVGGGFPGGTLIFGSGTPFTTFSLAAFNNAGAPNLFAIDNLTLTFTPQVVVPEPTSLLLLGTGLMVVAAATRRASARSKKH